MTENETFKSDKPLTDPTGMQERKEGSADPSNEVDAKLPDGAKNWQDAIQKKQEKIRVLEEENLRFKNAEKEKKLESMTEADKYKALAMEHEEARFKLEIGLAVERAVAGKKLPPAVLTVLKDTPWVFPEVKAHLDLGNSNWEQVSRAVQAHISEVVASLEVGQGNPEPAKEPERKVDPERAGGDIVVKDRPLTKEEYDSIMKDTSRALYEKNRDRIFEYLTRTKPSSR